MNLEKHKITTYEDNVADLPDYPSDEGYTAQQLKAIFDGRTDKEIKEKFNGLIDELAPELADLIAHSENMDNPHGITSSQLGLGAVDNTSDMDKPVSTAQAEAIKVVSDMAQDAKNDIIDHANDSGNPHHVTAAQLGLDKVDNTPDEEKRVLYATDAGYAEHAQRAGSAEAADSALYDFDGNNIVDTYATKGEVSAATTTLNEHVANKDNPHGVTKEQLGLDKVDNIPDAEKSVRYATAADTAGWDDMGNYIYDTYATKGEVSTALGDISTALDSIIALQNSYIGG